MGDVTIHQLSGTKKALDACRLVESLHAAGHRVVVWIGDGSRAATFDEYLWTFSPGSFVPHSLAAGTGEDSDPVVIVSGALTNPNGADTLVVVDRLDAPERAASFAEVHDLAAGTTEDDGKQEAWEAAGRAVTVVSGISPPS